MITSLDVVTSIKHWSYLSGGGRRSDCPGSRGHSVVNLKCFPALGGRMKTCGKHLTTPVPNTSQAG